MAGRNNLNGLCESYLSSTRKICFQVLLICTHLDLTVCLFTAHVVHTALYVAESTVFCTGTRTQLVGKLIFYASKIVLLTFYHALKLLLWKHCSWLLLYDHPFVFPISFFWGRGSLARRLTRWRNRVIYYIDISKLGCISSPFQWVAAYLLAHRVKQ